MSTKTPRRLIVGISGASGTIYGIRMLEMLKKTDIETHLVMSKSAEMTLVYETRFKPKDVKALATVVHPAADIGASISSGSVPTMGMVRIEQGTTTMPMVGNEPDEIDAPMSAVGWLIEASARISFGLKSVS